jgi:hypothetical protein
MRLAGVFVAVLALGCGGGDKAKLEAMKNAMCACKDTACAMRVDKEYKPWLRSFVEKFPKGEHGYQIPADLQAIGDESDKCMRAARGAEDRAAIERDLLHPPERGPSAAATKLLAAMTTAKDQMCACHDKACATKVDADLEHASAAILKDAPNLDPSSEQEKQLEETGRGVSDCRNRVAK